jgi:hypothetical protein
MRRVGDHPRDIGVERERGPHEGIMMPSRGSVKMSR